MINKLSRNYSHSCESLILSDNPKKKMIQVHTRTFSISSSLPLYINPPYSTHTFFLQTAQQFTECLDRMLHTPVTSLITSQATARLLWSIMLFELWPLSSPLQLPSMCEEGKVLGFHCRECLACRKNIHLYFFFVHKRIEDCVATL